MFPRKKEIRHVESYHLEITFSNGEKSELDFKIALLVVAEFSNL